METYGLVRQVKDGTAVVKVVRQSSCGGNCAACNACGNREILATVRNPLGAQCGDVVKISSSSRQVLRSAFLLYFLPVLVFAAVYLWTSHFWKPIFSVCLSAVLVIVFYWVLKKCEKKLMIDSEITAILPH